MLNVNPVLHILIPHMIRSLCVRFASIDTQFIWGLPLGTIVYTNFSIEIVYLYTTLLYYWADALYNKSSTNLYVSTPRPRMVKGERDDRFARLISPNW